jgi:hypothetical protein
MEENQEAPPSPEIPIPKASYNIDWDNFDDSINPFQTSKQLGNSPPKNGGIVKPPLPEGEANPFTTRSKMASSPPSSPKVTRSADVNENEVNENSNSVENNNEVKDSDSPQPAAEPKKTTPPK